MPTKAPALYAIQGPNGIMVELRQRQGKTIRSAPVSLHASCERGRKVASVYAGPLYVTEEDAAHYIRPDEKVVKVTLHTGRGKPQDPEGDP